MLMLPAHTYNLDSDRSDALQCYNFPPSTHRWYHSSITRGEADTLLLTKGQHGSFLIYPAVDRPGYYVLCVRVDNQVLQILICCKGDGVIDVEGGPKFTSLTQLMDYYQKNPLIETSGSVLHLKHPFHATSFLPANILQHVSELQKPNPDVYGKAGFWEEFEVCGSMSSGKGSGFWREEWRGIKLHVCMCGSVEI